MYNVLVLGNGGREAALAIALLRDPQVNLHLSAPNYSVYDPLDPCNPARVHFAPIANDRFENIAEYINNNKINYVLPGSENILCSGIVDFCESRLENVKCLGPNQFASQLEGSKSFGKKFLQKYGVPTGQAVIVSDIKELENTLQTIDFDARVVKADGLAAGKGVVVCNNLDQVRAVTTDFIVNKRFGASCELVLIEELFCGPEISYTVWINGNTAIMFPPSSDYKRLLDDNKGPNTGGMGNVCRTPFATPELDKYFVERILKPIMQGMQAENLYYTGPMFIGTIVDRNKGLQVLEINVRFGDPETQVIIPAIGSELFSLMKATLEKENYIPANARLVEDNIYELQTDKQSVCVVAASKNYPEKSSNPEFITGLDDYLKFAASHPNNLEMYFAGVSLSSSANPNTRLHCGNVSRETFLATGGRVLAVVGSAENLELARNFAYQALKLINFEGMQYRKDIARFASSSPVA